MHIFYHAFDVTGQDSQCSLVVPSANQCCHDVIFCSCKVKIGCRSVPKIWQISNCVRPAPTKQLPLRWEC